jgi:hypothetical protein
MRDHNQCRSHLNHLYGSQRAGAPQGNTNAFKTGQYVQVWSKNYLKTLAYSINIAPDQLPQLLALPIQLLHDRQGDPLKTLLLLGKHFRQLANYIADQTFVLELNGYVNRLPTRESIAFQSVAWQCALNMTSINKVNFLRTLVREHEKINSTGKTINGIKSDH